MLQAINVFLEC